MRIGPAAPVAWRPAGAFGRRKRGCLPALLAGIGLACATATGAGDAGAQPYARFAVADSALADAVRSSGAQFENAWNALMVAELRATLARADSATRLLGLARRVAAIEPLALGTRIGGDALGLRARWTPAERRRRIEGGVAESLGAQALAARAFARADSLFGTALRAYEQVGERRRIASVWGSLGSAAYLREDMGGADSLYRRALAAREAIGDLPMTGNALNALGSVAFNRRRLEESWAYYQRARAVRERTGERAALGTTLNNLGNVATAAGRRDSAAVFFRAALELTVAQGDSNRTQEVLNNFGALLSQGEDPARALPYLERALVIRRQGGDPVSLARVLNNIGGLLGQLGRYGDGLARLAEAREVALAARSISVLREVLVTEGRVRIWLGDGVAALPALERALALADSLGDARGRAEALNNLSLAARLAGDAGGADRFAWRALEAASTAGDSSLVRATASVLGELAFDRGDLDPAHDWFARALAAGAGDASLRAADILNLGAVAARRGRLDEADAHFQQGLALSQSGRLPDVVWPALLGRGDVAERRGDRAGALRFDRQAAALIESLRARQGSERPSVRLLARRMFAFEALIHVLTQFSPQDPDSGYAAEAFHWSERARARSFLDLVAATEGEGRPARPLTLAEAQRLLISDREALLVYSVGDSSTSLWVLRQRTWRHFSLPPRRLLKARVEILRQGLADPDRAESPATRSAARALHRMLIEPARPMLEGVERLTVAPDGILAFVPFEALLATDAERGGRPARGAYLVERYAIAYVPSASALATRLDGRGVGPAAGIVALGDPAFGPVGEGGLEPLPHSAAEVAALAVLAGSRPLTRLTGRDATRDGLLGAPGLSGAALIHVATHGLADEAEPERSGFWLAGPDSAPGFVSVRDILGLRLEAGMVTLSACETGLGRIERGEGVIGLPRAFLAAGARRVVVSLWKVNDRSTARLMEEFYRRLLIDDEPATVALARAKRTLLGRDATRSPFHWAPFVLVGSAGRLGE